ncbi:MAG: hypothetical protein U0Q16_23895 [Bryobacteraceae bacterium]
MELTWLAMIASLSMGLGALCLYVFAVKRDYFRDIEDTKYQVFWSDVEDLVTTAHRTGEVSDSKTREDEE